VTQSEACSASLITYRVDRKNRIIDVSASWRAFAVENGGDAKVLEPVGDSLWDHISDRDTQDLYLLLLEAVRRSRAQLSFPYRCDSPTMKRFMAMTITPDALDEVVFRSEVVAVEPLSQEISVTNWSALRIREVHICSSCRKVKVGPTWREISEAFGSGEVTTNRIHFRAVHRVCPHCLHEMQLRVGRMVAANDTRVNQLVDIVERLRAKELAASRASWPQVRQPPTGGL